MNRVLFCNIATMKSYDNDVINDPPTNGGRYVKENYDAFEKINFHKFDGENEYYGFVEVGGTLTGKPRKININKLGARRRDESINNVLVVFCTKSTEPNETVIVGWYKNATVFRRQQKKDNILFYFTVGQNNATLISPENRVRTVPRKKGNCFGFGQCNLWYAQEPQAQVFKEKLLRDYIKVDNN